MRLPALVAHADWSVDPNKRWRALAKLQPDGSYRAFTAQLVGPLESLCARLEDEAGDGPVLLGFDSPIGIPSAYAARAGITDFRAALVGTFDESFYRVAEQQGHISLKRPFYPMQPGGRRRHQLLAGLGLGSWSDLLRRCDRAAGRGRRPAPCSGHLADSRWARRPSLAGAICWRRPCETASTLGSGRFRAASMNC